MSVSETMSDNGRCRLCVREKPNQISVFRRNLSMRIMKLADVVIREDDWLPKTICLDCEIDIEKCFEFIARIQWADKKFRDEANQIEVEESIFIKQEHCQFENFMEEDCDDVQDHCDSKIQDESDKLPAETKDEIGQSAEPFNLVEIIKDEERLDLMEENEERSNNAEAAKDPLSQGEPFLEVQGRDEYAPAIDPLICLKEEAEAVDLAPSTSTKSSSVRASVAAVWPEVLNNTEVNFGMIFPRIQQNCVSVHPDLTADKVVVYTWQKSIPVAGVPTTITLNLGNYNELVQDTTSRETMTTYPHLPLVNSSHSERTPINLLEQYNVTLGNDSNTSASTMKINKEVHHWESNNISMVGMKDGTIHSKQWIPKTKADKNRAKRDIVSKTTVSSDCSLPVTSISCDEANVEDKKKGFCLICNVNCGDFELLQEHKDGKDFICRVCTARFDRHSELEAHFAKHITNKCTVCDKKFPSRKELRQHRTSSKTCCLEIECDICHRRVFSQKGLYTHKSNCHRDRVKTIKCSVCSKLFKRERYANLHMKGSHCVYEFMECKFCHKLILGPERLKVHIKLNHLDNEVKSYVCSSCPKIFNTLNGLKVHEEKHDVSENLCELCGISVKGKNAMKNHMERKHSKTGIFTCKHCNQTFELEIDLKRHCIKTHKRTVSKPAFCEICGKVYKSVEVLKKHKLIHSDEKPFKCGVCGAAFKQLVALQTHGRVHTSVDKYFCNGCGKSFRWKQTFARHVKKCEEVGKDCDDASMSSHDEKQSHSGN